jgi:CheY-like chemotaxis protein
MKTILYVHDQQISPAPTASYLQMAGYQVQLAASGDECLQIVSERLPSLVLMDVLVEGKNGFDLCRALRKKYPADQLPIVLASSIYRSRIYREEAMQAGAQLYLVKPFELEELIRMVHELLDVHACLLSAHHGQDESSEDVHRPSRE